MKTFTYTSNNSGGGWWLNDDDWINLEKAGWRVEWGGYDFTTKQRKCETADEARKNRYLDALAKKASKDFNSHEEAVAEFESITGENYDDEGCECCGSPHYIY